MGGRLSKPRGPDGVSESVVPAKPAFSRGRVNARTIVAPAAAFTMALLLFVYTRTSIRAAKENAQRHRDADTGGGGIDLVKENRRRHGLGERIEGRGNTVVELAGEVKKEILGQKGEAGMRESKQFEEKEKGPAEDVLKAMKGKKVRHSDGD
nr:hypothetical protein CFP56_79097 [Quercus suber]